MNGTLKRYSQDKTVNNRGKELLDRCHVCELIILNGRRGKDTGIGNFTRIDTPGKSVVDYVLCSPDIFMS